MQPYDPTDLEGQDASRKAEATRRRLADEVEQLDVMWLMGSKRGRRILWRLLEQSRVFQLSFDPDASRMAFNEGARSYGNRLWGLIHSACPEQYAVMLKESNDASSRSDDHGDN